MRALLILIFIGVSATNAVGQTISFENDTIKWEVDSLRDTNANVSMAFSCQFISDKLTGVQWVQENGGFVTELTINSTEGLWTDLSADGYKQFNVTYLGKQGNVRFSRAGSAIQISMSIMDGEVNTTPYIFSVTGFSKM